MYFYIHARQVIVSTSSILYITCRCDFVSMLITQVEIGVYMKVKALVRQLHDIFYFILEFSHFF